MKASLPPWMAPWLVFLAAAFLAAGCETVGPDGSSGRRPPAQTPLEATRLLFDGAVEMRVSLAPFFPAGGEVPSGPGGRRDGFRSPGRRGEEFGTNDPEMGSRRRGMPYGLEAPSTHRLRVSFANRTETALQMDVNEVRSLLGVFGVRPNRLVLPPGGATEIDPMRSSIGENFGELDVAVQVRYRGKSETVSLRLTPASPAPAAP